MFGSKTLTRCQRFENGFREIILSHIFLLCLFVLLFWYNLNPAHNVSNLIAAGMISDPSQSQYAPVRFFVKYIVLIIAFLVFGSFAGFVVCKAYNNLRRAPGQQSDGNLTQPLLPAESTETAPKQIISKQVVISENSIQIIFSDYGEERSYFKGELEVKEGLKAIAVKVSRVRGTSPKIKLNRDGETVCSDIAFNEFDGSFN